MVTWPLQRGLERMSATQQTTGDSPDFLHENGRTRATSSRLVWQLLAARAAHEAVIQELSHVSQDRHITSSVGKPFADRTRSCQPLAFADNRGHNAVRLRRDYLDGQRVDFLEQREQLERRLRAQQHHFQPGAR
jgi:hypothetical protein